MHGRFPSSFSWLPWCRGGSVPSAGAVVTPSSDAAPERLTDDLIVRFLGGLWRLNRSLKQGVEPLLAERYQLDLRRYFVLQAIARGHAYPKVLAEALGLPPSLLSRYLEQLTKAGLVGREIDRTDSRRIHLTLTDSGHEVLAGINRAIKSSTSERLSQLDSGQLLALLGAIEALAPAAPGGPSSSSHSQEPA